jgi:hypothetical protein
MKQSKTVILIGVVMLLTLANGGVVAQDTAPGAAAAAAPPIVAPVISYQGRLVDPGSGSPLTGTFDFEFSFWDDPGGGGMVSGPVFRGGQEVVDGYYRTTIEVEPKEVDGKGLWLQIRVRPSGGGAWDTLSPRIEVLPVMYAMSVRPGARAVGDIGKPNAVINATSTSDGFGLRGESLHQGGFGVVGYNGSELDWTYGAGVKGGTVATGYGVLGSSDSGHGVGVSGFTRDGYGVQGVDGGPEQGRGYGGYFSSSSGVGAFGWSSAENTWNNMYAPGLYGRSMNGVGVYGRSESTAGSWRTAGVMGWGAGGAGGEFYTYNGNIIEGWDDASLIDDMSLNLRFKVAWWGDVYADGTYLSPAADFAELLPARDGLEPGDVLVVDAGGRLTRSTEAYQPTIVGVYSTKPGFLAGAPEDAGGDEVQLRKGAAPVAAEKKATVALAADGKVPLAIAGIVPVKASAENGAITPGALLVASNTPGHCMLAGDSPAIGTVLGKALQGLEQGTGSILMLVMLQ